MKKRVRKAVHCRCRQASSMSKPYAVLQSLNSTTSIQPVLYHTHFDLLVNVFRYIQLLSSFLSPSPLLFHQTICFFVASLLSSSGGGAGFRSGRESGYQGSLFRGAESSLGRNAWINSCQLHIIAVVDANNECDQSLAVVMHIDKVRLEGHRRLPSKRSTSGPAARDETRPGRSKAKLFEKA